VRPPARKMPTAIWDSELEQLAALLAGKSCQGNINNIQDITGDIALTANIAASKTRPSNFCAPIKFWSKGRKGLGLSHFNFLCSIFEFNGGHIKKNNLRRIKFPMIYIFGIPGKYASDTGFARHNY
jgi:hypothetical protein